MSGGRCYNASMGNFNRDRNSRDSRGGNRFGGGNRRDRQMFKTVCSNCGKDCQVPFKPTGDKPVYCSDCFEKMGGRSERKPFDRPRFGEKRNNDSHYKVQFSDINAKLDKILKLLETKPTVEVDPEVKSLKTEKATKKKTAPKKK